MKKVLTVKKQGENEILFKKDILGESIITVGNNPTATLELKSSTVAPEQFVIIAENERLVLMNRADGTFVNGEILDLGSKFELSNGDRIDIGTFQISLTTKESFEINESVPKKDIEHKARQATVAPGASNGKDFSAVLNSVKEEDSFYFHIVDKENVIERILFDSDEIWLGTNFEQSAIKKSADQLDEIFAHIKKDWSGAVIYPESGECLFLNGDSLEEPHRLKNEDEIELQDDFASKDDNLRKITFHEPVVLLALNSILPEDLPEPVSLKSLESEKFENALDRKRLKQKGVQKKIVLKEKIVPIKKKKPRKLFYFSILEIFIMAVGTLVTAALIFLVLEFV